MKLKRAFRFLGFFTIITVVTSIIFLALPQPVRADGFITFELGTDQQVIYSSIPGLKFTNTNGYDWIYGDWRTGNYNGKYPNGAFYSNGNFFAWMGARQGIGRIDFTGNKKPTYLSLWVSASEAVTLTGYYGPNNLLTVTDRLSGSNINTETMKNLVIRAPLGLKLSYAEISGTANRWLIDDLSTDAAGVRDEREPVILIPGIAGSSLITKNLVGIPYEVWPNYAALYTSTDDSQLLTARLNENGYSPFLDEPDYRNVFVKDILRVFNLPLIAHIDAYQTTIQYFKDKQYREGEDFIVCPYDWRKDLRVIASNEPQLNGNLEKTLEKCVNDALKANKNAKRVNLIGHSMGGLVARQYISNPENAKKVHNLFTLGTPYFGSPKITSLTIGYGCFYQENGMCEPNKETTHDVLQNFPSSYQLSPTKSYFDVYPSGYIERAYGYQCGGEGNGSLDYLKTLEVLKRTNSGLVNQAQTVFEPFSEGWNKNSNGVNIYMFVGDQNPTIGKIYETKETDYRGNITYDYSVLDMINGDGTVPLHSAEMKNDDLNKNLTGGARIFYSSDQHGNLQKNTDILNVILDVLTSSQAYAAVRPEAFIPESVDPDGILLNPVQLPPRAQAASELRDSPLPLTSKLLFLRDVEQFEVLDMSGNRMGPDLSGGGYLNSIPDAGYDVMGDTFIVHLPPSGAYTITLNGGKSGQARVNLESIVEDAVQQNMVYADLPIPQGGQARLEYDPSQRVPGLFQIDSNGDGVFESTSGAPVELTKEKAEDRMPPTTSILLEGILHPDGYYTGSVTVTLNADDGPDGSGVTRIEYSTDYGRTVHTYTGPFVVDADTVEIISAKATDLVGNEEVPLATTRVGKRHLYLPLLEP